MLSKHNFITLYLCAAEAGLSSCCGSSSVSIVYQLSDSPTVLLSKQSHYVSSQSSIQNDVLIDRGIKICTAAEHTKIKGGRAHVDPSDGCQKEDRRK